MIFQHTSDDVLNGDKTQTRRIIKPGEYAMVRIYEGYEWQEAADADTWPFCDIVSVHTSSGRVKWVVGKDYAVQPGRGKKAVGRIRVTRIWRERVQDITEDDAHAEGVRISPLLEGGNSALAAVFFVLYSGGYRGLFKNLWNHVHGDGAWDRNDLVWVIEFERVA